MDVIKRIGYCGIAPLVVLDAVEDACPTAEAMLAGGIDVMEISLHAAAGFDSIKAVAKHCPNMCVGAGAVVTLEQCKQAVKAGAKFIVSPGFNCDVVKWCMKKGIPVIPGCVTPTEITAAMEFGVKVFQFFPARVYGGLDAMKALAESFGEIKFIPTGGIADQNLLEYISAAFVHAVGGSWICAKADIDAGNFAKIASLCAGVRGQVLGYELAHVGINCEDEAVAQSVSALFDKAFDTGVRNGNSSIFASSGIEVMKSPYLGANGHVCFKTASIERGIADLTKKGFTIDMETAKYKDGKMVAVYIKETFGGFAVHLLQR